jgi:hypothetical protein
MNTPPLPIQPEAFAAAAAEAAGEAVGVDDQAAQAPRQIRGHVACCSYWASMELWLLHTM